MADRDSCLDWLSRKSYRVVRECDPMRKIVDRLVLEGRASWISKNRARYNCRDIPVWTNK